MTVDEIVNNDTIALLTREEEKVLALKNYIFNKSTPTRIKKSVYLMWNSYIHDNDSIDFNDKDIKEGLEETKKYDLIYCFYSLAGHKNDDKLQDFPHYQDAKKYFGTTCGKALFSIKKIKEAINGKPITHYLDGDDLLMNFNFRYNMFTLDCSYSYSCHEERELIVKSLIDNIFPTRLIPHEILKSREYIDAKLKNEDENTRNWLYIILNSDYSEENERHFLDAIGFKNKSIEECLKARLNTYKATTLDFIYDIAIIRLYGQKLLMDNKLFARKIFMNKYSVSDFNDTLGDYEANFDNINLYVSKFPNIEKLFETVIHEIRHVIQFDYIRHADIDKDSDVDIYSKDAYLRDVLGRDYYTDNYENISYELDAEFNAYFAKYSMKKKSHVKLLKLPINAFYNKVIREVSIIERDNLKFEKYGMRKYNGNLYFLSDLFDQVIISQYEKSEDVNQFINTINSKYPIFMYEYSITKDDIHKKSILELVNGLINAENEKEEKIYECLIRSSIDKLKYYNHDINRAEIESIISHHKIPVDIKNRLRKIIHENQNSNIYKNLNSEIKRK